MKTNQLYLIIDNFLTKRMAHKTFQDAINNFPKNHINTKLTNIPYTFWHLLEHIRIAQKDILDYIEQPNYESPAWPDNYWPPRDKKATFKDWANTIAKINDLIDRTRKIIEKKSIDQLLDKIDHVQTNHSILREILLIIDHNSYHIGQFVTMRMILGEPSKVDGSPV